VCTLQPLYGFGAVEPLQFSRAQGHNDVFYVQDRELDVDEVRRCMVKSGETAKSARKQPMQPAAMPLTVSPSATLAPKGELLARQTASKTDMMILSWPAPRNASSAP
jgi:hypothetical protein